jgi:Protein of unknown function (DUF2974)
VSIDSISRSLPSLGANALRSFGANALNPFGGNALSGASNALLSGISSGSLGRALMQTIPTAERAVWNNAPPVDQAPQISPQQLAASRASGTAVSSVDTRTLALISRDVYEQSANPPPGFSVATKEDLGALGLSPQDLTSTQSAFTARVYVRGTGADAEFVVAFRGSTSALSDWGSNLRQATGLSSDHYARALQIGQKLARSGNENVTITGHSLGGGLASAAAIASGRDASTFNAAGLSSATIASATAIRNANGGGAAGAVSAFYVRGEILSAMQDGGDRVAGALIGSLFRAPFQGAAVADLPEAYGTRIALNSQRPADKAWYQDNPGARHSMNWVLSSLGR